MKKKQILVCGTGFGKIYLKAIAESKNMSLWVYWEKEAIDPDFFQRI